MSILKILILILNPLTICGIMPLIRETGMAGICCSYRRGTYLSWQRVCSKSVESWAQFPAPPRLSQVVHVCNPSTREVEGRRIWNSRSSLATQQAWGKPWQKIMSPVINNKMKQIIMNEWINGKILHHNAPVGVPSFSHPYSFPEITIQ